MAIKPPIARYRWSIKNGWQFQSGRSSSRQSHNTKEPLLLIFCDQVQSIHCRGQVHVIILNVFKGLRKASEKRTDMHTPLLALQICVFGLTYPSRQRLQYDMLPVAGRGTSPTNTFCTRLQSNNVLFMPYRLRNISPNQPRDDNRTASLSLGNHPFPRTRLTLDELKV